MFYHSKDQQGFITHWLTLLVLLAGLAMTIFLAFQVSTTTEQRHQTRFLLQAEQIYKLSQQLVNKAETSVTALASIWPHISENPNLSEKLLPVFPLISSIETLSVTEGLIHWRPLPEGSAWRGANHLLTLPELEQKLKATVLQKLKATALQKPVTMPISFLNQQSAPHQPTRQYAGELRWLTPVTLKDEEIILVTGTDLVWLTTPLAEATAKSHLILKIFDLKQHSTDPLLTLGISSDTDHHLTDQIHWKYQNILALPGRDWLIQITPAHHFMARTDDYHAWAIFIIGVLATVLLTILINQRTGRRTNAAS